MADALRYLQRAPGSVIPSKTFPAVPPGELCPVSVEQGSCCWTLSQKAEAYCHLNHLV